MLKYALIGALAVWVWMAGSGSVFGVDCNGNGVEDADDAVSYTHLTLPPTPYV